MSRRKTLRQRLPDPNPWTHRPLSIFGRNRIPPFLRGGKSARPFASQSCSSPRFPITPCRSLMDGTSSRSGFGETTGLCRDLVSCQHLKGRTSPSWPNRDSNESPQRGALGSPFVASVSPRKSKSREVNLGSFLNFLFCLIYGAPGEIRTPGLLIRSQSLYPAELRAHTCGSSGKNLS